MVLYLDNAGLSVQMVNGSSRMATSGKSQRLVLYSLKPLNGRGRLCRVDNWSTVVKKRPNESFESQDQTVLVFTKRRVGKSSQDV